MKKPFSILSILIVLILTVIVLIGCERPDFIPEPEIPAEQNQTEDVEN